MSLQRSNPKRGTRKQSKSPFAAGKGFAKRFGKLGRGLRLEPLEQRRLLAVDMVTSNLDDGGAGTLRAVIAAAAPGDTIGFQSGITQIDLTQGQIEIAKNLTVQGPGADSLTIEQTTSGGARLFQVDENDAGNSRISVSMSGLTLTGGHAGTGGDTGGGISNAGLLSLSDVTLSGNMGAGGGLFNLGAATLANCIVSGNQTFANRIGAGILNEGGMTIVNSVISKNISYDSAGGGGIANEGVLTLEGSVVSGNTSDATGGGIFNDEGKLTVLDSTISCNSATGLDGGGGIGSHEGLVFVYDSTIYGNSTIQPGGGIDSEQARLYVVNSTISANSSGKSGGGIYASGEGLTLLINSIVAGNNAGQRDPDTAGDFSDVNDFVPKQTSDHNLIGNVGDATGFTTSGPDASLLGSASDPIDPKLGPLANNGGSTQTMALLPGSPAIDAGDDSPPPLDTLWGIAWPTTDQRGLPRLVNSTVDIGAFELSRVTAGMNGTYTMKLVPGASPDQNQTEILDPNNNVVFTSPTSLMPSLMFANTGAYMVNLAVDYSAGDPLPAGGLTYDGGGNGSLSVTGYDVDNVVDTYTDAHSGTVQVGTGVPIRYSGLLPLVALNGTQTNLVMNLPAGAIGATLQDDGTAGNGASQFVSSSGAFEATTFTAPTGSLTVNAGAGGDAITIARGFTADFNANLNIIGGAGDDTFNVYATPMSGKLNIDGGGSVHGNVLNAFTPTDAEIFSDATTPPVVTIGTDSGQPINFSSIQQLNVTPGNGLVNVYGDDNQPATNQNDGCQIVGTGPNALTLAISGNDANQSSYNQPITLSGVRTLNVYGEAKGTTGAHNDANQLSITPYADNTPRGWGVQTLWNAGGNGALVYNGVAGVSENIIVTPSGSGVGQLVSTNSATNSPVAVVNYSLDTNIIVNGNDGSAGDTDTLTLKGLNPGASGGQQFTADFATPGSSGSGLRISDVVNGKLLSTLQGFTNINSLNVVGVGAPAQNTLLVDGYDPASGQSGQLDASLSVGEERSSSTAGVVNVFQKSPPGTQYPEINYSGIGTLSVNSASSSSVQGPSIAFGSPGVAGSGLEGASDTGVAGQPGTLADLITADRTPTFYGSAQAAALVRLYVDTNANGKVDNADVFIGETTATPAIGGQASGQWTITSSVDLNNPKFGFAPDGLRTILAVAEDAAGDVSSPQALTILLDTQGPQIGGVSVAGDPNYNLFLTVDQPAPTPLVNALDVAFTDTVLRDGGFSFPAVNSALATTAANYQLVGRTNGVIPISSVNFSDNTTAGGTGTSVATLHFATPLPDDFYTLTISDQILDDPGNALDGDSNGSAFPTGNGTPGGSFSGSFVVNSRPHLAVVNNGSVSLDINGDGTFDPSNTVPDSDFIETFGLPNDQIFSGKFAGASGTVSGFDQLGAYGYDNNQWRWLLNLNPAQGTSNPTTFVEPLTINNAQPVAGYFAGDPSLGMQVGLFSRGTWWLDVLNHHTIDSADVAAGGKLKGNMTGTPIVGDFDGDGKSDLATYQNGTFEFDLSSKDAGGNLTGRYNMTLDAQALIPALASAGTATPVAADLDGDGITDLGLYVASPGGRQGRNGFGGAAASGAAEWFWLVSHDATDSAGVNPAGAFASLSHAFNPAPLGHDLSYQYGDASDTPLIGLWDPPTSAAGTPLVTPSGGFIAGLYESVLGREPSQGELASLNNLLNSGQATNAQVSQMFVDSSERLDSIINGYYEQYLGRAAEQAGLDYWVGIWRASGGSEAVQAGIIGSPEYFATAGRLYPDLSPDAAWVTALYNNLLGRAPDAAGLDYWVNDIQTHSLADVVLGFVSSDEYRSALLDGWYEQYLGRPIDTASAAYWLAQMEHGVSPDQVVTAILSSAEFINRS